MKTNILLDYYLALINEQDDEMSGAKKHVIKILVNAFLFNPTKFPEPQQERINERIQNVQRSVNRPISALVREIKSIINMDRSLTIESVTLDMVYRYLKENTLDATEPQSQDTRDEKPVGNLATATDDEGSDPDININLIEVFPAYRDLIISALRYIPVDEESRMVEDAVREVGDEDPSLIIDTVSGILNSSQSDTSVENELANI